GCTKSLRTLIEYNRCDVLGMRNILYGVLEKLLITSDMWFERSCEQKIKNAGWAVRTRPLPIPSQFAASANSFASLFNNTAAENAKIIGIDLTGSEARPSGWATLTGAVVATNLVSRD